ncbi:Tripartite DNA replication factor [Entomortierella beljakovae]|nr:Tripartite DNA replication factor [Entomortierella beljakovae]
MVNVPSKRKATTSTSTTSKGKANGTSFKKSVSASNLGSRSDSKLSQPLQSFSSAPPRNVGAKAQKTIIIDDDSDNDENADQRSKATATHGSKPQKRPRADKQIENHPTINVRKSLPKIEKEIPFEDRMPVSPAADSPIERVASPNKIQSTNSDAPPMSISSFQTTPQKKNIDPSTTTPTKLDEEPSPFRTPTNRSRHPVSTIESLGLSPQDSVFWVRTPPSEALKRLERLSSGRSHEEETSSAGTALRRMAPGPRDRIKDMLNTLRGTGVSIQDVEHDLNDLDDLEQSEPSSPTKELVDRHRNLTSYRERIVRHSSAQELGSTSRRRGRIRASRMPNLTLLPQFTSPTKCRDDVLKMIEQINANMDNPTEDNPFEVTREDGSKEGNMPSTPQRSQKPENNVSPGEFDSLFSDLEMDEDDLEELTQFELAASMPLNIAGSTEASLSSDSNSVETCVHKSLSFTGRNVSDMDVKDNLNSSISQAPPSPSKSQCTPTNNNQDCDELEDIYDLGDDFEDDDTIGMNVLVAQNIEDQKEANIYLCDSWVMSRVALGDIVHVIRASIYTGGETMDLILNDSQGFLIIKPDHLVSTSVLAESFTCVRKPIVDIRARKSGELTIPLIHGTMLHEVFQHSLISNDFSTESMKNTVDKVIKLHFNDLYLVNESLDVAREKLSEFIPSCQEWARQYLKSKPSSSGDIHQTTTQARDGESKMLCVNKILDIEENIWSPMFGLKGKIDASIQITLNTTIKNQGSSTVYSKTLTVPFELKTGKKSNVVSHRAQTMLYTLLLSDRYDINVQLGLLFYLKSGEFIQVPAPHDEMRTILMQRNEIAFYEDDKVSLPPMLKSTQVCRRCFSFSSCTVLHKLMEDGTPDTSGLGTVFEEATDHLNETHSEFFRKWNRLLSLEQGDVAKFQSQIWSMLLAERRSAGNCLGNMLLMRESGVPPISEEGGDDLEITTSGRFARHRYKFKMGAPHIPQSQQTLSQTLRGGHSLLSSNISVGDPIVVSSEQQHYALAIGHVIDMSLNEITVGLDRPLYGPPMRLGDFNPESNQTYRGLVDIADPSRSHRNSDYYSSLERDRVTFRIDKDEMTAGIARTRDNLVQLFRADVDGGDAKRRRLVVDMEKPEFDLIQNFEHNIPDLNSDQRQAVEAVLSAKDFALILGMPGTGKTTTIAQVIQTLVEMGKSVLLSSYTHSAVDNVLLKLPAGINTVRLGNKDKVHRDAQKFIPDFSEPPLNTPEAIHNFYGRCQVVGTTCLGIGDTLFAEKRFDYCIVDEASQITLPACLGPIRFADVFVLVGDHNQLPPLVKNPIAKKDGFDLSLFKLLSDQHPQAVTSLTQQYRMNKDIMLLSNTLVYRNELKCATEEVANKVLEIPSMDNFRKQCHTNDKQGHMQSPKGSPGSPTPCFGHPQSQPCWLEQILDSKRSVVFVDTDELPAHEVQVGSSTQNPTEALLVQQLTEALISGGVSEQDIGIISVLRAQLKVLSRLLSSRPLLDIHTVDRYQGKDKDCVIVSLVRSNAEQHVGELLKDWRRINVAFTRAKKKLVVFGSRRTLQGSPVFEQFLKVMERQEWVLKLPQGSQHFHPKMMSPLVPTKILESSNRGNLNNGVHKYGDGDHKDDEKENYYPGSDTIGTKKKMKKVGSKIEGVEGQKRQDIDGENSRRKDPKVLRMKAEVILRQMPITKNIIDSL